MRWLGLVALESFLQTTFGSPPQLGPPVAPLFLPPEDDSPPKSRGENGVSQCSKEKNIKSEA